MLKRTFKKIRDRYFNASLHAKYLIITVILLIAIFLSGMYMCINTYHSIYKNEISAAKEDSTNTYDNLVIFEKRVLHIITLCQADGSVNFWHCQFLINPLFSEVLTLFVHKKSDTPFFVYNVNRQTNITKMKVNRSWTLYSTYLI